MNAVTGIVNELDVAGIVNVVTVGGVASVRVTVTEALRLVETFPAASLVHA